ncbi:lysozyme inhibitor LprI family protein [Methylobacter tundripaludum]|nr:lysozyme inhibitor LprI family protein [Methylobacter tundripaludum]
MLDGIGNDTLTDRITNDEMWRKARMKKNCSTFPITRILGSVPIFALFCAASTVNAASFDCTKAAIDVEKIICSDTFISKLDDRLNINFREEIEKASDEEKTNLIKHQKHWLKFTRNRCEDAKCVRRAYWSKSIELGSFSVVRLYKKSDGDLKQILSTANFYSTANDNITAMMCQEILDGLKQAKAIDLVKPKISVMSYEDTALDPWKQHCNIGQSLVIYPDLSMCPKAVSGHATESDDCWFPTYGQPPFKIFEIPIDKTDKQRYLFYMDAGHVTPDVEDAGSEAGGSGDAGFFDLDANHCKATHLWPPSWHVYRNIINIKDKYYFLGLDRGKLYKLTISPIDNTKAKCDWSAKNPNP